MLLPQLTRHDVELVALCDAAAERLAERPARFGVAEADRTRGLARRSLARGDLDAVGMAVGPRAAPRDRPRRDRARPAGLHREAARRQRPARAGAGRRRDARGRAGRLGFMKRYSTGEPHRARTCCHAPDFGPRASFLGEYMTAPDLFRGGRRLHRFLPAPLRALFRPRAAPDGRGGRRLGAPTRARARQAAAACRFPLRERRASARSSWARTSPAARPWSGGR